MKSKSARGKKIEDVPIRQSAVGMIIEKFEGSMQLLAESFDSKIEGLERNLGERFDEIDKNFLESNGRFREIDKNQKITLKYLLKIDDEILEIKKKLNEIEKNTVGDNAAEFQTLKTKILEMEKEMKEIIAWKDEQQKLNFA